MVAFLKRNIIRIFAYILVFFIDIYRKFKPIPQQIYFCYNQSIHQIYHSIFVAVELSNIQKKYVVVILSTSKEASSIIEEELSSIPNNVKFIKITHPGYNKIGFSINWFAFLCRIRMYKPKAVIVTDYFDNVFRQLLLKTFWIYIPHGLCNHEFAFDPHIKDYELVVLPGERDLNEFNKKIGRLKDCLTFGYSKLDYFLYHPKKAIRLFKDDKPVIIYNPHFKKLQSSFFDKGMELIKALSGTNNYNIIFMPHPDLARMYPDLVNSAGGLENVIVISRPKINLDYFALADIYITDVSSSVFEWLYFDKPVIFFNTKKIDWKSSKYYLSWVLGKVVEDIPDMIQAINYLIKNPDEFKGIRKEVFEKTFSNKGINVSKMIANGIRERLGKNG